MSDKQKTIVAVEAKDGSTVWISLDQLESWRRSQQDNSPERHQRVQKLADEALQILLRDAEQGKNSSQK